MTESSKNAYTKFDKSIESGAHFNICENDDCAYPHYASCCTQDKNLENMDIRIESTYANMCRA